MTMLPPLTANDLAIGQAVAEASMADVCEVLGSTAVEDTSGGLTQTPAVLATTVCGVQAVSGGAEQVVADRLAWSAAYSIRLPVATVVTPANQLRVNGTRTYQIGAILDRGAQATAKIAVCRERG